MKVRTILPSLGACGVIVLLLSAAALAAHVRTVVAFDPAAKQTPENLAIADDGTIYVSLSFAGQIRRISPTGRQETLTMPTMGGITTGLAIDRYHGGDLDVGIRSSNPQAAGIWRIPRARFADPIRIAALPTDSFANGITFDAAGKLYIADSDLGRIWRIARGASRATVWAQSRLLAPTGAKYKSFPLPGANGIKERDDFVYVTNTASETVLTIPVLHGGSAGKVTVRFRGIQGDDFAFAADGDLYVAENPLSTLIRVDPTGRVTRIATAADGLQNPSAVAFDPRPALGTHLYITNSAYFGTRPSLQEIVTGANDNTPRYGTR
jgi:sugar lactone lactonase YvrE